MSENASRVKIVAAVTNDLLANPQNHETSTDIIVVVGLNVNSLCILLTSLNSVCPKTHPELSLRGAFCATKQSPLLFKGIASAKNTS